MPDPVRALAANYLRVGKWSQCAHCHIVHSGPWDSHYCGAEWQTPEMGFVVGEGIDEIRPEWAAAARALREPDENVARLRHFAEVVANCPEVSPRMRAQARFALAGDLAGAIERGEG